MASGPQVVLYSTTLHTWEVWQNGRPLAVGTLEDCERHYPGALPVSDHQRHRERMDQRRMENR